MTEEKPKIVSASPKVRKFAREVGADLQLIDGSQRQGRVIEEDVKLFVKKAISGSTPTGSTLKKKETEYLEYNHSEFGLIDEKPIPRLKKLLDHIYKNLGVKFHMLLNMMKLILQKWINLENL